MRFLLAALLLTTTLAGCTLGPDATDDPFVGTCPAWTVAPDGLHFHGGYIHRASSENPDFREEKDYSRTVHHPGTMVYDDKYWRYADKAGNIVDAYDLHIMVAAGFNSSNSPPTPLAPLIDSTIRITAHLADKDEQAGPLKDMELDSEGKPAYTGPQIKFIERLDDGTTRKISSIFVRSGEELDKTYRIELTDGTGPVAPSSIRLDYFFEGDQDNNPETDSFGAVILDGKRLLRLHQCI